MKLDSKGIKGLFNWQAAVQSPNFLPLSLKLSLLLVFPLATYFQDFIQVFSLALTNEESQYIIIVPFVVAYFLFRRRQVFLISRKDSKVHDLWGISFCLLALLVYVLGSYSFYTLQLHLLSLPFFVAGIIVFLFGANVLRLLVFPVSMMTFLSPLPLIFLDAYGGNLMSSDGTLATLILKPFLPIEITYQPIVILTTITSAGEKIQFSLSAACSGIYSLTAFLFCAVVFGYLASGSIIRKVLYGVLAISAAYFLNVFRITATVVLGHFFGVGLAVEFFHAVGGTVLAFLGTLLLLVFGSKVLKLSFIHSKAEVCSFCKDTQDQATQVCMKCARVLRWEKIRIRWKHMLFILFFLLICADLIVQASAVNYNVIANSDQNAVNFNPSTGEIGALTVPGWTTTFVGRETQAEAQLGLQYVGDYVMAKVNETGSINAIFEISDLQSRFHTWEGCLNYQAYPIQVEKITYVTIYSQGSSIINGEIIVAKAPTLNQTLNIVYWYDVLNLKTNGTVTNLNVKVTLIKYLANSKDNATQNRSIEAATNQLFSLSQKLEENWSQNKNSNYSFVVDLYKNKEAFEVAVAALFVISFILSLKQLLRPTLGAKFNTNPAENIPKQPQSTPPTQVTAPVINKIEIPNLPEVAPIAQIPVALPVVPTTAVASHVSKLSFVGVPASLEAGVPSGPFTVQLQDDSGNPINAESPIKVTLSPGGKWFLDADGQMPIVGNQITIDSGSNSSSNVYFKSDIPSTVSSPSPTFNLNEGEKPRFYLKNKTSGPTWLGALSGNFASAVASVIVTPKQQQTTPIIIPIADTVDHIVISPNAASITAGESQKFLVEAFDKNGESLGDVAATLSAPGAIVDGSSVSATAAGFCTVTGTYAGKSAHAVLKVSHVAASSLAITPVGSSITAGGTKTYSALASDVYGNVWDVTSQTDWSITSEAGGSWSGNIYTSARAGSWTVTGTYNSTPYTAVLMVNAADLDHFSVSTVGPQTAESPFTTTITAMDAYQNTAVNYTGVAALKVSSGSINPAFTGGFVGGVWSGTVAVSKAGLDLTINVSDGGSFGTSNPFTVNPTVFAFAGVNGSINPSGSVAVSFGSNQTCTITPDPHYHVADVLVDETSVGALTSYTFEKVVDNHTIKTIFAVDTNLISASAAANGTISPDGKVSIEQGGNQTFTITPDEGFHIADVLVDGTSVGAVSSYSLSDVQESHSIFVVFAIDTYTIGASAGSHGAISPAGSVTVDLGKDQIFTIMPEPHHHIEDVLVDGSSVGAVSSYAFNKVSAGHSIVAKFAHDTYTINVSAGVGGTINPSSPINLILGSNQTIAITPDPHFHIVDVLVDGVSVGAVSSYTFSNIEASHSISAVFAIDTLDIIASTSAGGTVTPNGVISVDYGSNQTFAIKANEGYHIVTVIVDNISQTTASSKTNIEAQFTNVTAGHMITAIFAVDTYKITASAGSGGAITPNGLVKVNHGEDRSFAIKAQPGYQIADVVVDGVSQGAVEPHTTSARADFANVRANHTIAVTFAIDG